MFIQIFAVMVVIIIVIHLLVFLIFPKTYLDTRKEEISSKANEISNNMNGKGLEYIEECLDFYSKTSEIKVFIKTGNKNNEIQIKNNVDVDLESDNNSLIIEERAITLDDGKKIKLQFVSTADMQKDAIALSFKFLPYSLAGSLLFSAIVSLIYAKSIKNDINEIKNVTDKMMELDRNARLEYESKDEIGELKEQIKSECHYVIEPELTYTCFADAARNNSFNREQLQKAFNNIEQSDPLFADLFTDIDLYSNRLGTGDQKQSDTISNLIKEIDKADLLNSDAEILGNAYEYLIGQFASETGKKAGEFYTPQAVSKILTRIAIAGQEDRKGLSVYDPCMGSGSLLLNAKKYAKEPNYIKYYGQELNTSTYNLARMNMFLHGIVPENQVLRNGDTLDGDWPTGEETDFNMVLMNPPYSAKWSAAAGFLQDERFSDYGVLAPKSKADYAFLLHGLYHLKSNGTMAIVLPHGVLFRGAAEGKIREKLLRSGNIYAVIGLPANLFYNTSIPTCIVVLKKHREGRDVLFIDASQKFEKGKKQNAMTDGHIDSVMKLYNERVTVDKEAYLASFDDIERNDFNLNIPRYVDNFEKEEEIDLNELLVSMTNTDKELEQAQGDFLLLMKELTSPDEDVMFALNELIRKMEG